MRNDEESSDSAVSACRYICSRLLDLTEPERLGLVMAVGIDQDGDDKVKIICAEVNVRGVTAGGDGMGGGGEPPFHVHTGSGRTIFDAISRLSMEPPIDYFLPIPR
ncbi:hypothetical protein N752_08190 [Desulforamulus aquiferis]|nr:hypothetical protein [Desulforamulus aquiferis]RYD05864.1 hypothetical protein N752_08190 [Desulforamulus aquiferis]